MITTEQKEILEHKIIGEGFEYCFDGYSSWKDIKDEKFHELREAMLKAKYDFLEYLDELGIDTEEY